MNTTNEIQGIRLNQTKGIIDLIESKSLLNLVKSQGNENLHLIHEKVLFATIAKSDIAPDMKLLSALSHFESVSEDMHNRIKKTQLRRDLEQ